VLRRHLSFHSHPVRISVCTARRSATRPRGERVEGLPTAVSPRADHRRHGGHIEGQPGPIVARVVSLSRTSTRMHVRRGPRGERVEGRLRGRGGDPDAARRRQAAPWGHRPVKAAMVVADIPGIGGTCTQATVCVQAGRNGIRCIDQRLTLTGSVFPPCLLTGLGQFTGRPLRVCRPLGCPT
jgi:hypothetical protein